MCVCLTVCVCVCLSVSVSVYFCVSFSVCVFYPQLSMYTFLAASFRLMFVPTPVAFRKVKLMLSELCMALAASARLLQITEVYCVTLYGIGC